MDNIDIMMFEKKKEKKDKRDKMLALLRQETVRRMSTGKGGPGGSPVDQQRSEVDIHNLVD